MTNYYTVVKIEPNCWNFDGSPIFLDTCGHKHRTVFQAAKCEQKLLNYHDGMWSAKWHNSEIFKNMKRMNHFNCTEEEIYQKHQEEFSARGF